MERLGHLHVVEIDRDLDVRLKENHPPERLTIHEGDAPSSISAAWRRMGSPSSSPWFWLSFGSLAGKCFNGH